MITLDDYFAGYPGNPEITDAFRDNASLLLQRVNSLLDWAETQGWQAQLHQHTGSQIGNEISGNRDGGWRPQSCPVGAPQSAHKQARAVDVYDPDNSLDGLITDDVLEDFGLYREAPESTVHWCHLTDRAPGSGHRTFNP